jgi:dihydrofolate reductase
MRKVFLFNRISMDGFYAGPNGEIDWFIHDPEVDKATHEIMHADTMLLGRVTYQMFESYWPHVKEDPNEPKEAKVLADELDQMTKVVFSKTLKEVTWENSRLVKDHVAEEVRKLKQGEGADIVIFGSGSIVQQLAGEGLIDEYLILITPVILGTGKLMFKDVKKSNLELLETRSFNTGNVLLHHRFASA